MKGEQEETKSSVYWRGEEEKAFYEAFKETAERYGFSYSDFVKLIVKDPLTALKLSWKWFRSDYDAADAWVVLSGGVPKRDLIQKEAEKMTVEQLQMGLIAQRAAERLIPIYKEVYEEELDKKLRELNRFKEEGADGSRR